MRICIETAIVLVCFLCAMQGYSNGAPLSNRGSTIYVSKLGNNKDGASWQSAYTTIQAALSAVPDDSGSHRIVIRPDTYFEANLYPAHRGAKDAYNELIGDTAGKFGSGTEGTVVIDSGDPQQHGFKSYDWWGTMRSTLQGWSPKHTEKTFSAIGWDRWKFSRLYATGGDAGIFFDMTNHIEPFSVIIEDCVSIGRAFGGGVASCLSRPEEPITFRRCHLWSLDWWGDTAGAYIRVENTKMPDRPDVLFEDCTMVGPQCALKSSNFGFHTYSHIQLTRCQLIALNFSQPGGTPTDGIIQSVQEGKLLHVDLEDCTLLGYKVFGVIKNKESVKDIGFTTKGDVKAYVQFQQDVPAGMHRMGGWPVETFQAIAPKLPVTPSKFVERQLVKKDLCEVTPFIWKGRLCQLECIRPAAGGSGNDYYLVLRDAETGKEFARCAEGYGLGSLIVHRGEIILFASKWASDGWHDVTLFRSKDLKNWKSSRVIEGVNEQLFNSSVCKGPDGFVLAYESNDPKYPPFTIKFARSKDLVHWTKEPESTFGTNRYTACPCIRFSRGYYYVLYLEHRTPRWWFETYITRSPDLIHWKLSSANPVLRPEGLDEGINASDPDLVEWKGKTYLYYAAGDQLSWMNVKRAVYPGSLGRFLESWFTNPGIPDWGSAGG